MKSTFVTTLIFSVLCMTCWAGPANELQSFSLADRTLCCASYNGKMECAIKCGGQACTERCESRCGIFNSLCWSSTCAEVTNACTTPPPPPAPAPSPSCLAVGDTSCLNNNNPAVFAVMELLALRLDVSPLLEQQLLQL